MNIIRIIYFIAQAKIPKNRNPSFELNQLHVNLSGAILVMLPGIHQTFVCVCVFFKQTLRFCVLQKKIPTTLATLFNIKALKSSFTFW